MSEKISVKERSNVDLVVKSLDGEEIPIEDVEVEIDKSKFGIYVPNRTVKITIPIKYENSS